ncbi:MAG: hypothetical protein K5770_02745 [Lachnospiraceae bacterium]|nr:hypothetical protein [Lachnospiraceae bacterium]
MPDPKQKQKNRNADNEVFNNGQLVINEELNGNIAVGQNAPLQADQERVRHERNESYFRRMLNNSTQENLALYLKNSNKADKQGFKPVEDTKSLFTQKLPSARNDQKLGSSEDNDLKQAKKTFMNADLCTTREKSSMEAYFGKWKGGAPSVIEGKDEPDDPSLTEFIQSLEGMELSPAMFTDEYLSDHMPEMFEYARRLRLYESLKSKYPVFFDSLSQDRKAVIELRVRSAPELGKLLTKHMYLHGIKLKRVTGGFEMELRTESEDKRKRREERDRLKDEYDRQLKEFLSKRITDDGISVARSYVKTQGLYSKDEIKKTEALLQKNPQAYAEYTEEIGKALDEMKSAYAVRDELLLIQSSNLRKLDHKKPSGDALKKLKSRIIRNNKKIVLASRHAEHYQAFINLLLGNVREIPEETLIFLSRENHEDYRRLAESKINADDPSVAARRNLRKMEREDLYTGTDSPSLFKNGRKSVGPKILRFDQAVLASDNKMTLRHINDIRKNIRRIKKEHFAYLPAYAAKEIMDEQKKIIELLKSVEERRAKIKKKFNTAKEREIQAAAYERTADIYDELVKQFPKEQPDKKKLLYRAKEQAQIEQHRLLKLNSIESIQNDAERERELNTYKRHRRMEACMSVIYQPSKLAIEGAVYDHGGMHLVNTGRAFLGGTKPMYYFEDRNDPIRDEAGTITGYKKYLYKEAVDCIGRKKPERALVTEAASKLQRIVCGDYAIDAFAAADENGEVMGSFQVMIEQKDENERVNLFKWQASPDNSLSDAIKGEILREHTLDWLLCNFDTKGENFLHRKEDGHLSSFDKEASFSFINAEGAQHMSLTYRPHSNDTLYNTVFREYVNGNMELDFGPVLERAEQIRRIPDAEYMAIFEPMLRAKCRNEQSYNETRAKILVRKNNLVNEYQRFIQELRSQRGE